MPDPKPDPALPNRETHGANGTEPATSDGKPASSPTPQRQESETVHHGQHEQRPGKPVGGAGKRKS